MSGDSNVAKGTDYERFVRSVYQTILNFEGVENINVLHDTKITGKSGCQHQIDVYWEFKLAGQTYKTAIECKAFNKEVSIGRVRDFFGVLTDVPNLNGIFATLIGYQSGAKRYAGHYGITLKELRFPTKEDWEGRIKDIVITIHAVMAKIVKFSPKPTQEFLKGITKPMELQLGIWTDAPIVFDQTGVAVASYEELRQMLPTQGAPFKGKSHSISFPNHIFKTNDLAMPIEGIDFIYDVDVETMTSEILGEQMAMAIIRDVRSGNYTFIDKNGSVRSPRDGCLLCIFS